MLRPILLTVVLAGCTVEPAKHQPPAQTGPDTEPTTTQVALQKDLRSEWIDHATLLRNVLLRASAGAPSDAEIERASQPELAQILRGYYGDSVASLEVLFRDEALDVRDIGSSVKGGDSIALQASSDRL